MSSQVYFSRRGRRLARRRERPYYHRGSHNDRNGVEESELSSKYPLRLARRADPGDIIDLPSLVPSKKLSDLFRSTMAMIHQRKGFQISRHG